MFTPPLPELDITGARLKSNSVIFSVDISVDVHLVTFSLL